jgi:predicted SAM-dependent methyltransferase
LLVAQFIHNIKPNRHIDIASRIGGFVANVASFRSIEMMDIRDLNEPKIKNMDFLKKNLMNKSDVSKEVTDSISCLHTIEHFGLGRYGDDINPVGHIKGFNNIIRMLKPDGRLYISFPIGKKNEVHFNAHRIFHPKYIFN